MPKRLIVLIILMFSMSFLTACQKQKTYLQQVDTINEKITKLPDAITLDAESLIDEITKLYQALPAKYQAKVLDYDKVTDAKTILNNYHQQINQVIALIEALPALADFTLEDEETLQIAQTAYDALAEHLKAYITNYQKLASLLLEEEKLVLIENVNELINNLPSAETLSIEDKDQLLLVRSAYDALDEDLKGYIINYQKLVELEALMQDKEAVANLISKIEALPTVENLTINDQPLLEEIHLLYQALKPSLKALITNYQVLETLENQMSNLLEVQNTILDCVSDFATSNTKDQLILENEYATFSWKSWRPTLYVITNDGFGQVSKAKQTHYNQYANIVVTINYKNGPVVEKSKEITVGPVLYDELPSTPVATYFSVDAVSMYTNYSNRYKTERTLFSDKAKEVLDIVYYSFAIPYDDGTCKFTNTSYLEEVLQLKESNVRVVACINGVSSETCATFNKITADDNLRQTFVTNLMNLVENNKLDGVDIDWETVSSSIKVNATGMNKLMQDIRAEMNRRQAAGGSPYFLSAAVPASSWGTTSDRFDFKTLNNYVDYINLMSYDMNNSAKTTHLSPLYRSEHDGGFGFGCDYGVNLLTSLGLSKSKIIIGSAGYGKAYKVTGSFTSTTYPALGVSGTLTSLNMEGSYSSGTVFGNVIEELIKSGEYQQYLEVNSQNQVVGSYLYNPTNRIFVTYDSEEVMMAKYEYAKAIDGVGLMCWCYPEDTTDTMINGVYRAMHQ